MDKKIRLEKALFQKGYLYFVVFFLFMIWGFWATYFTRILNQDNYRMHLHGAALIFWCLLLIMQPYLIRTKKVNFHRRIGKLSYLLVPFLLFTTVDLFKYRFRDLPALTQTTYFATALVLNALVAFTLFYSLAIYHRKRGAIHARYMLCTAFPMFPPITDRIIGIYFPSWMDYLPTLEGTPLVPIYGFALADFLLLVLCVWDWRSHRRWNVFPFALMVMLVYHFSVLNFYKYPFWAQFSEWFVRI